MPLLNIIKIFQTIKKLLSVQEFGLEIYSAEFTRKRTKQELSLLHVTLLLDLIYVPTKYYQIFSNSIGVMACSRLVHVHNKKCMQYTYWSLSMPLPNIIKIF